MYFSFNGLISALLWSTESWNWISGRIHSLPKLLIFVISGYMNKIDLTSVFDQTVSDKFDFFFFFFYYFKFLYGCLCLNNI